MWRFPALALLVVLMGVMGTRQASAGNYLLVDTTNDFSLGGANGCLDENPDGDCSLRDAIFISNAIPALKAIIFNIGAGVPTIVLQTPLPAITQPVFMDGATGGADAINIYGTNVPSSPGLSLENHSGSTIKHMVIDQFNGGAGISITGGDGHTIVGNKIGTNGTQAIGNLNGVVLQSTTNNVIGGDVDDKNVISGNFGTGVLLDIGADNNTVAANSIGLSADWSIVIPNHEGVIVRGSGNQIGTPTMANVISGNVGNGVLVNGANNTVKLNLIGANPLSEAKPNGENGVFVGANATGAVIGGSLDTRNVISGNALAGVHIESGASVEVSGNIIGLNPFGVSALPNQGAGIEVIQGGAFTTAGVASIEIGKPQIPNTISGNAGSGIVIGADGVSVRGNNIGVNLQADAGFGNSPYGIYINASQNNTVGGSDPGYGNFITASSEVGVLIDGDAEGNQILGNWIGGKPDIGGNGVGIRIVADFNDVMDNTIVNNLFEGLSITGNANVVSGNSIGREGVSPSGGNGAQGIVISGNNNRIGPVLNPNSQPTGTNGGILGNVISNNVGAGILVEEGTGNTISLNSIGTNSGGGIDLAPEGSTPNDQDDPDTGANNLQNHPVLTSATIQPSAANGVVIQGGGTKVQGTLNSNPNITFVLEFFASESCTTGAIPGKGEQYLDSLEVTTNASGDAGFSIVIGGALEQGEFVTATATHDLGSTSEFSNCITPTASTETPTPTPSISVTPTPSPTNIRGDADCDGNVDTDDFIAALSEVAGVPPGVACPGNVGCDGSIDAQDALDILAFVASPNDFPFPSC
ncbi:MAG: hypothetical protein ABI559_07560 [Chloroflexota bacterium]